MMRCHKEWWDWMIPMVHYLFFFTPKEPKMVLLVLSGILLLHFSTAVRYESVNFFNFIPEGLSSFTKYFSTFCQFLCIQKCGQEVHDYTIWREQVFYSFVVSWILRRQHHPSWKKNCRELIQILRSTFLNLNRSSKFCRYKIEEQLFPTESYPHKCLSLSLEAKLFQDESMLTWLVGQM